jgi:hypothetical protein
VISTCFQPIMRKSWGIILRFLWFFFQQKATLETTNQRIDCIVSRGSRAHGLQCHYACRATWPKLPNPLIYPSLPICLPDNEALSGADDCEFEFSGACSSPFHIKSRIKTRFFGECTTTGDEKNPRPGSSDFLTVKKDRTVLWSDCFGIFCFLFPIYGSSRDLVGIPSGPSRAPIFAFLGTAFGQSRSSRDPVGHQFSNFWHHVWTCREAAKSPKNAQKHCKNAVFYAFSCLPTLVPDWIPTGSRLAKSGAQKCKNWCPIGSRLGPDWVPTGSRPGFFKKSPSSLNLSTYFWNFSTLYTVYILIIDYYYCYSFFVY